MTHPHQLPARLIASACATWLASLLPLAPARAAVDLIAMGTLSQAAKLSGLTLTVPWPMAPVRAPRACVSR